MGERKLVLSFTCMYNNYDTHLVNARELFEYLTIAILQTW